MNRKRVKVREEREGEREGKNEKPIVTLPNEDINL